METIFLTHLHADHIMDLVNIFQGSWPSSRIDVYGPGPAGPPFTTHDDPVHPVRFADDPAPGVRRVIEHLNRAFAMNINARIIAERRNDYLDHIHIHEIGLAGEVGGEPGDIEVAVEIERGSAFFEVPPVDPFVVHPQDEHGVTVTATFVQHAPVFPALAYRFDTPAGSVVFSGDTGACDNVVTLAAGADILVHEVIDLEALLGRLSSLSNYETVRGQLLRSHTPVEVVGSIAARAGVGRLVLSHLVPGEGSHSPEQWEALVREGAPEFTGEVVCGVDLDEFGDRRRALTPSEGAHTFVCTCARVVHVAGGATRGTELDRFDRIHRAIRLSDRQLPVGCQVERPSELVHDVVMP